ncbi:AraC family transcriptional regulator [Scandinavium sp. H11S7]|uniref:AraC family transcriptional regulator n=1 Tax=Scandinavium hiltneri TaxID=2926519 RepID=A0ABT2E0Z6_9ENTR|nr:AraC family transcriptional regulator [Scandinavium hiltneri]MCS2161557.1 AraC family transcriptional regulator [Scandinavium hiltneri]
MKNNSLFEHINLNHCSMVFRHRDTPMANYYHWHQCLEIIYISNGYGLVIVDNQQYTAKPGRIFIFPPFKLHKIQIEGNQKHPYNRTIIHLDQIQILNALTPFPRIHKIFNFISSDLSQAQAYDLSDNTEYIKAIFKNFESVNNGTDYPLNEVIILIMQIMNIIPESTEKFIKNDSSISTRIMNWIGEHYSERLTLELISRELGYSPNYISKIFKNQTGGTIQEYIICSRIKHSCDLLQTTDLTISQVAETVGFRDVTYFITRFKKLMIHTPFQYKKNTQKMLNS